MRHSACGKGHEEGGSTYAKAGSSLSEALRPWQTLFIFRCIRISWGVVSNPDSGLPSTPTPAKNLIIHLGRDQRICTSSGLEAFLVQVIRGLFENTMAPNPGLYIFGKTGAFKSLRTHTLLHNPISKTFCKINDYFLVFCMI